MRPPPRLVRVFRPGGPTPPDDLYAHTTPEERLAMIWQLTCDAWAFRGEPVGESRLQRHVVRVIRSRG